MQPRIDIFTLGVPDLDAARRFYVETLGWEPTLDIPGEIVFLQVGHGLLLALFGAEELQADVHGAGAPPPPATTGISLGHIVETEAEVVQILERAAAGGGQVLKQPQRAEFGGFHGYFADPAGFRWEVATNPGWSVSPDGRVTIVPIEPGS